MNMCEMISLQREPDEKRFVVVHLGRRADSTNADFVRQHRRMSGVTTTTTKNRGDTHDAVETEKKGEVEKTSPFSQHCFVSQLFIILIVCWFRFE